MMIQKIEHDCGCVLTQVPGTGGFVASTICDVHRPRSEPLSSARMGQLDELPNKPFVQLHMMDDSGKCVFCGEKPTTEICRARGAGSERTKASLATAPTQQITDYLTDVGMLTRAQAPAGDVFNVGDVVVTSYVWGRLQRLLESLKAECAYGTETYSNIGGVQDLLWRCSSGKGVAVTRCVTGQSNNERDSEWRNALREAIKDCAVQWGVNFNNVEVPTAGPAVFALKGMLVACFLEGRKQASKKISDAIYELAMGHKS